MIIMKPISKGLSIQERYKEIAILKLSCELYERSFILSNWKFEGKGGICI
jgi:hypothetical protein